MGQLQKIKNNFRAKNIVFVGDRGMRIRYNLDKMTSSQIDGIEYITGLNIDKIRALEKQETIQLNMFSEDIAEIETPDNIRYVLCTNPILAQEQTATRLVIKTRMLKKIEVVELSYAKILKRNFDNKLRLENGDKNKKLVFEFTLKQLDRFKFRARKIIEKYNMQAYYSTKITQNVFTLTYDHDKYLHANQFDGKYVFVTNV